MVMKDIYVDKYDIVTESEDEKFKLSNVNGVSVDAKDDVNEPPHYRLWGDTEAIDVIKQILTEEEFIGYCKGNLLKYRLRAGKKNNAEKDIAKALWYETELDLLTR